MQKKLKSTKTLIYKEKMNIEIAFNRKIMWKTKKLKISLYISFRGMFSLTGFWKMKISHITIPALENSENLWQNSTKQYIEQTSKNIEERG